ncbi:hypothetical protein [Actinacidiphila glaucinigra]|uniref:hypothetical protein n=1 Tax=Actinacidiphila glaucinigra TaxID=235986 RepID=UPI0036E95755
MLSPQPPATTRPSKEPACAGWTTSLSRAHHHTTPATIAIAQRTGRRAHSS